MDSRAAFDCHSWTLQRILVIPLCRRSSSVLCAGPLFCYSFKKFCELDLHHSYGSIPRLHDALSNHGCGVCSRFLHCSASDCLDESRTNMAKALAPICQRHNHADCCRHLVSAKRQRSFEILDVVWLWQTEHRLWRRQRRASRYSILVCRDWKLCRALPRIRARHAGDGWAAAVCSAPDLWFAANSFSRFWHRIKVAPRFRVADISFVLAGSLLGQHSQLWFRLLDRATATDNHFVRHWVGIFGTALAENSCD